VVDGKAQGSGVVQWFAKGMPTTSYEGEMRQGLSEGHGVARENECKTEGEFKHGCLISKTITIHYAEGCWYKGEHKDGFKEGKGEEMMKGGVRYVGDFKQDRFEGAGEMIWPTGDKISGEWRNSKLVGIGTYFQSKGGAFKVKMTEKGIERL
jgi:hypothetical protein